MTSHNRCGKVLAVAILLAAVIVALAAVTDDVFAEGGNPESEPAKGDVINKDVSVDEELVYTGDLTISQNKTVTIKDGGSIKVKGNFLNNGILKVEEGGLVEVSGDKFENIRGRVIVDGQIESKTQIINEEGDEKGDLWASYFEKGDKYVYTNLLDAIEAKSGDVTASYNEYAVDDDLIIDGITVSFDIQSDRMIQVKGNIEVVNGGKIAIAEGSKAKTFQVNNGSIVSFDDEENAVGLNVISEVTVNGEKGVAYTDLPTAMGSVSAGDKVILNQNYLEVPGNLELNAGVELVVGESQTMDFGENTLTVSGKLEINGEVKGKVTLGKDSGRIESSKELGYQEGSSPAGSYFKEGKDLYCITNVSTLESDLELAEGGSITLNGDISIGDLSVKFDKSKNDDNDAVINVKGKLTAGTLIFENVKMIVADQNFKGTVSNGTGGRVQIETVGHGFTLVSSVDSRDIKNISLTALTTTTPQEKVVIEGAVSIGQVDLDSLEIKGSGFVNVMAKSSISKLNVEGALSLDTQIVTVKTATITGKLTIAAEAAFDVSDSIYIGMSSKLDTNMSPGNVSGDITAKVAYVSPGSIIPNTLDLLGSIRLEINNGEWFTLYGQNGAPVPKVKPTDPLFSGWDDGNGAGLPEKFGTTDIVLHSNVVKEYYQVSVKADPQVVAVSIDGKDLPLTDGLYVSELLSDGKHILSYMLKDGCHGTAQALIKGTALPLTDEGYEFVLANGIPVVDEDGSIKKPAECSVKLTYKVNPELDIKNLSVNGEFKTKYDIGDTLDVDGMEVIATFMDGKTKNVTGDCVFSPSQFEEAGEVPVEISYDGVTTSFTVTVSEAGSSEGGNTLMYVAIGVVLVIGVLAAVFIMKKQNGGK